MRSRSRSSPPRPAVRLIGTVLPLLFASCVPHPTPDPFRGTGTRAPSVLEVENRHWADMTISVRRGGRITRLGLVTTNGRDTFVLDAEVNAAGMSVTLLADPVGSDAVYESPLVSFGAGETYVWTLAVELSHSTLQRR